MKIAITQRPTTINGFEYDALSHGWYNLLAQHVIIPISNHSTRYDVEFDLLIISGGDNSPSRTIIEEHYLTLALEQNKPVLGVCHGAFFLNEYFGGVNQYTEGHHNTDHPISSDEGQFVVNSYHSLCIHELSKELRPTAWTNNHTEAFKHIDLPVWGIVWHPERMEVPVISADVKELLCLN